MHTLLLQRLQALQQHSTATTMPQPSNQAADRHCCDAGRWACFCRSQLPAQLARSVTTATAAASAAAGSEPECAVRVHAPVELVEQALVEHLLNRHLQQHQRFATAASPQARARQQRITRQCYPACAAHTIQFTHSNTPVLSKQLPDATACNLCHSSVLISTPPPSCDDAAQSHPDPQLVASTLSPSPHSACTMQW